MTGIPPKGKPCQLNIVRSGIKNSRRFEINAMHIVTDDKPTLVQKPG
jgi:hypothetical protein